ncbi:MAG: hypothetical protein ABGW69_00975 [Nanoarchaeota archaeon]
MYYNLTYYLVNNFNYHLLTTNLTKVALMVWKEQPLSTIVYQVFPIGQYVTIAARGCKHGHCKTKYRTAGTADYIVAIWSCYNYSINNFLGQPNLLNCSIFYITHTMPFVYGNGLAIKSNIHTLTYVEQNYGNYNYYLNTSYAIYNSLSDFVNKLFKENYFVIYNGNVSSKSNNITSLDYSFSLSSTKINIESGLFSMDLTVILLTLFAVSITLLASTTSGTAFVSYLASVLSISPGAVFTAVIFLGAIALIALSSCSSGGSTEASFTSINNHFYYSLKGSTCDSSFCARYTYDSDGNLLGQGFITKPVGKYTFETSASSSIVYRVKEIYKIVEDNTNNAKAKELLNKLINMNYYSLGDLWATYLALVPTLNYLNTYVSIHKTFTNLDSSKASYYKSIGFSCVKTYVKLWKIEYTCSLNFDGKASDFLLNALSSLKNYYTKSLNYGSSSPLGIPDLNSYNYFVLTSKVIDINVKDLYSNYELQGVVENKFGKDQNGPYFIDNQGNKHYLIQKVEIGDKTYYLPALLFLREPGIGELKVS